MNKLTKGITVLALSLITAQAEVKPFVSVGVGSFAADGDGILSTGSTITSNQSGSALTLSAGAFFDDNFMASISYTTVSAEDSVSVNALSLSAAYILGESNNKLRPFLGASYNTFTYEESGFAAIGYSPDTLSVQTAYVSADIGVLYELNDVNSLSLMYKQGISSNGEGTVSSGSTVLTVTYENVRQAILSYNHKF